MAATETRHLAASELIDPWEGGDAPSDELIDPWAKEDAAKANMGGFLSGVSGGVSATGGGAGLKQATPASFVGGLIQGALSIGGIIFTCLIFYGGFMYMTAQGSDEKIKKAKGIISSAVIGLALTLSGWIITREVIRSITTAARAKPPVTQP